MSKLRMFRDDIKRSVGLFLAIVMVFSSVVSVPVKASETLKIIDDSRFVAIGYKPEITNDWDDDGVPDQIYEEYVFQTYKTVVIDNTAQIFELSENAELNADLYVTIDGTEYKVMEFSSNPLYDEYNEIGIEELGDYYYVNMAPVYYENINGEVLPVSDYYSIDYYVLDGSSSSLCCSYAVNFGFSEEIVNFLVVRSYVS